MANQDKQAKKYVAYYRVSTQRQGRSGLGLDAQKASVARYLNGDRLIGEFTEIESGKNSQRPELAKALDVCRANDAVLLIAKLDRLSRDLHFITGLQNAGVKFICCDMPEATELTIHLFGAIAQHERKIIAKRTREALQQAKERGTQLGNPNWQESIEGARQAKVQNAKAFARSLLPVIEEIKNKGGIRTLHGIADALTARGIKTYQGKSQWWPTSVKNLIAMATG